MTAVAFSATLLRGPEVMGPFKVAKYKLQLPEVWVAAGVAWDLSGQFSFVEGILFGASGAIADHGYGKLGLIGTYSSTGEGMTASTCKLVMHQTGSGDGVVLTSAADSEDFKAVDDLVVWVFGS